MAAKGRRHRTHHKVEVMSCRQLIDKMLTDGHTYEEIQAAVREAGETIGKASLSRYYNKYQLAAERVQRTREAMQVLVESVQEKPDTDLAQAANAIMMQALLDRVAMAGDEFVDLPLDKVGRLIADLQRSGVGLEQFRLRYHKGLDSAMVQLKAQLQTELGAHRDLLDRLYGLVDQAADKVKAGVG